MTDIEPIEVRRPIGDNAPTATLFYGAPNLESLRRLADGSVHCAVTSPPYWGLRDYDGEPQVWGGDCDCDHEWGEVGPAHHPNQVEQTKWKDAEAAGKGQTSGSGQFCKNCPAWLGQFGLEPTPDLFVRHLVEIFRELRRVLRDDGTFWLNLGDSYMGSGAERLHDGARPLKPKDLVGVPWRAAFALQDDGWYLRSDIVWAKGNPMPESVRDRVTRAHEYIFMFTKRPRYFYDHEAIKEPLAGPDRKVPEGFGGSKGSGQDSSGPSGGRTYSGNAYDASQLTGRNKRSVWNVNSKPYKGAHFAVFPTDLVEPCVLAGTSEKGCCPMCGTPWERHVERTPTEPDGRKSGESWHPGCGCPEHEPVPCTVLDPFSGSGTTGLVSLDNGRAYVGLDINESYADLAVARLLGEDAPSRSDEDEGGGILELLGVQGG